MARVPESIETKKQLSLVTSETAHTLQAAHLEPDLHRNVASRDIAVGDIVLVGKGEVFPCDLVLLHSALEGGIAYVSTANLDGESNLKRVIVTSATAEIEHPSQLPPVKGKIRAQRPSTSLHEFEASIELSGEGPVPLGLSSLLLRGSILRNTEYIYGIVVYTGFDTKVALNMRNHPSKMSSVERKLNWVVLMLLIALATLVITGAIVAGVLQNRDGAGQWYMGENALNSGGKVTSQSLGTFLILFSIFIPVSLFVTFKFIRVLQALFMSADFWMRTGRQKVLARATNLNEMLREKRAMHRAVKDGVEPVKQLLLVMALCHSVTAVLDGNSSEKALLEYQGQSPDEVALVTLAREYAITLMTRTIDTLLLNKDANIELIQNHIDEFAKEVLQALVFEMKELEEKDFQTSFERFQEAQNSLENREEKNSKISAELEEDLMYVATTAVEDKLQDKVPETINFPREAGIKLWVLTDDKRETAENIAYSANLLDRNMEVVHIAGSSSAEVQRQLNDTLDRHKKKVEEKEVGVIIDGASLHHAIEDHSDVCMALSDHTKVVICCRLTPLQKALVVRLMREKRKAMTLAIGDGGNDVSMIQDALP
ncbi:unnamed protein product [Chondrus crispus]|uniref:P-type ATPase A domain-containing protein n=1 Tax=Chondrus crispus TaxID=2769 RepID=R7QLR0_CHOCR|nr:unnamed protein product [Chondrus crispus]CDF38411.1 unnamed protein product [Chondrus crispus]|eukprot:XP_005718304.1 unnamed protein product [Chondrus crispus]